MPGPAPAVAVARRAVRRTLTGLALPDGALVVVACSGGADSLALAAATAFVAPRLGLRAGAFVVDHGLQPGSDTVAAQAAAKVRELGLDPVEVTRAQVRPAGGGPEEAARAARYAALEAAAALHTASVVLLGHTRDDQAEQVLLGLARGSGARSLAGMPPARGLFARPLLEVSRAQTEAVCATLGVVPWRDPHNSDPTYARVRARRAVAALDADLGPGVAAALARSAELLRDDADLLDELAAQARAALGPDPVGAAALAALAPALRRRVWRLLAAQAGAGSVSSVQVGQLDALVVRWRGQGPVDLPGGVVVTRQGDRIQLTSAGCAARAPVR